MSRTPEIRRVLAMVVLSWGGASGCIHNHYYGTNQPGCPPVGSTVSTQVGSICDVPNTNPIIVSRPGASRTIRSDVIAVPPRSNAGTFINPGSQVVISQPAYGPPSVGQTAGRFKWRKPDPEGSPIMKAEGGLDDSTFR